MKELFNLSPFNDQTSGDQLNLFQLGVDGQTMLPDLDFYDKFIITFSGGKDSMATFLYLLELGVPLQRIELWHHLVDGREGSELMDWPVTEDYCRKFAEHFGVPIYFQWLEGGFEREMQRDNQGKAKTWFETPDGLSSAGGKENKKGTRLKFPQVSGNLSVRWCSSYLKIDVCAAAIRNQKRFDKLRTLVISGERGEESPQRETYEIFEIDRSGLSKSKESLHAIRSRNRWIDRLRPIKNWTEDLVWAIIERWRIVVHPCYFLNFSRCSCMRCIFGDKDHFATINFLDPKNQSLMNRYETQFGVTMKRDIDLISLIESGTVYQQVLDDDYNSQLAMSKIYYGQIVLPVNEEWKLPAGAYKHSICGPN